MYREFQRRLSALASEVPGPLLWQGKKGLEKESLRVTPCGDIARTPHPAALGSALTHPHITTDYSEALIELITPPFERNEETLAFLRQIHQVVYRELDRELLWCTSMPCAVGGDESVPIASYGTSNSGMMRHIYRRGLAHRYGRVMQVISGVHYNYSVPLELWPRLREIEGDRRSERDFVSDRYLGLVRNVLRYGWLLIYLFGASPALCRSFLGDRAERFQRFDETTRYEPFATSLRMSDIGYTNSSQTGLNVVYDGLEGYVRSLTAAIETPHPAYEAIGVRVGGEYRQLNANILQIENEFYSPVRPKQITERGEKPTQALLRRGVAYVEVRSLDVNPFSPIGVDAEQMAFLEGFMLFCLLHESPPLGPEERVGVDRNTALTAHEGRRPGLELVRAGGDPVALADWGQELLAEIAGLAEHFEGAALADSVEGLRGRLEDPQTTPSARMLEEMRAGKVGFFRYALAVSRAHKERLLEESAALGRDVLDRWRSWAQTSLSEQRALEADDSVSFESYLAQYFEGDPEVSEPAAGAG